MATVTEDEKYGDNSNSSNLNNTSLPQALRSQMQGNTTNQSNSNTSQKHAKSSNNINQQFQSLFGLPIPTMQLPTQLNSQNAQNRNNEHNSLGDTNPTNPNHSSQAEPVHSRNTDTSMDGTGNTDDDVINSDTINDFFR